MKSSQYEPLASILDSSMGARKSPKTDPGGLVGGQQKKYYPEFDIFL